MLKSTKPDLILNIHPLSRQKPEDYLAKVNLTLLPAIAKTHNSNLVNLRQRGPIFNSTKIPIANIEGIPGIYNITLLVLINAVSWIMT